MDLLLFAMLGGSLGWGSCRMMCVAHGTLTLIINVLAGISGAVLAGCFLVPLLTSPTGGDFTVAMSLVLAGAVAPVSMVSFLFSAPAH